MSVLTVSPGGAAGHPLALARQVVDRGRFDRCRRLIVEYSEIEESDYGETSSLPTLGSTISE